MEAKILLGRGKDILEIPESTWKQQLIHIPQHCQARLNFMTGAHHQIRYFVVKEMAIRQKPIEAELISQELNISLEQVKVMLKELQEKLFFLVRNDQDAVIWAYPVTVETTPHRLRLVSGECLYAA